MPYKHVVTEVKTNKDKTENTDTPVPVLRNIP